MKASWIALTVLTISLVSGSALAQRREYTAAIARGHAAVVARQLDAALGAYRDAARLQSTKGEPHYYIACVLRLQGDAQGALAAFETAARNAASGEDEMRSRALMNISFM